jgi:hypothetical protein
MNEIRSMMANGGVLLFEVVYDRVFRAVFGFGMATYSSDYLFSIWRIVS